MEHLFGYPLVLLVGVSLGMFGSGGSLLAFPVFVHIFSLTPYNAATYSLAIVFIGAITSLIRLRKQVHIPLRESLLYAIPSTIAVMVGRHYITTQLPKKLTLLSYEIAQADYLSFLFIVVAFYASYSMLFKKPLEQKSSRAKLPFFGLLTGALTAFIGAGGGFVIIPVLRRYAGMQLSEAATTSLIIITLNSFIGFTTSSHDIKNLDIHLLVLSSVFVMLGSVIGNRARNTFTPAQQERALGILIFFSAITTLILM